MARYYKTNKGTNEKYYDDFLRERYYGDYDSETYADYNDEAEDRITMFYRRQKEVNAFNSCDDRY